MMIQNTRPRRHPVTGLYSRVNLLRGKVYTPLRTKYIRNLKFKVIRRVLLLQMVRGIRKEENGAFVGWSKVGYIILWCTFRYYGNVCSVAGSGK